MTNTVALGAALGLVGFDFKILEELLTGFFSGEMVLRMLMPPKPAMNTRRNYLLIRKN